MKTFSRRAALRWALCISCTAMPSTRAFNFDGNPDIVWRIPSQDITVSAIMNQRPRRIDTRLESNGDHAFPQKGGSDASLWKIVATADFDRDGYTDLLWRKPSPGAGEMEIWLLKPESTMRVWLNAGDTNYDVVGTGDFNYDGYIDILWRNDAAPSDRATAVWIMNGPRLDHVEFINHPHDSSWKLKAVADFNNDGSADILLQNTMSGLAGIWYLDGLKVTRTEVINGAVANGWTVLGTGRFNQLANVDIVWRHTDGSMALWLMQGSKYLRTVWLPSRSLEWEFGGVGDEKTTVFRPDYSIGRTLNAKVSGSDVSFSWDFGDAIRPDIFMRPYGSALWMPKSQATIPYRYTSRPGNGRFEYKVDTEVIESGAGVTVEDDPNNLTKRVLVVVDSTIAGAIDLATLTTDLKGDGWTVERVDVPRHNDTVWAANKDAIRYVRDAIRSSWSRNSSDGELKAAILVGHVPIPHSGGNFSGPDGHGYRSLPADTYYGDVDGTWRDNTVDRGCELVSDCACLGARYENRHDDGIWDETSLPSNLELAVGRIDFANMQSAFVTLSETQLLNRYLSKIHKYRRGQTTLDNRLLISSALGNYNANWFRQGLRLGSKLFGSSPEFIVNDDGLLPGIGSAWVIHSGNGAINHILGYDGKFHSTFSQGASDLVLTHPGFEPHGGFFVLYGSCFMDFAAPDNVLRGIIGSDTSYNLGAMWMEEHTELRFEGVALGDTVGSGFVRTLNENGTSTTKLACMAWMGDPTLRLQIVPPTSDPIAERKGSDVEVRWTDAGPVQGHVVFRLVAPNGNEGGAWQKLGAAGSGTVYTDRNVAVNPNSQYRYMVRASALKETGCGSYYCLSNGSFSGLVR